MSKKTTILIFFLLPAILQAQYVSRLGRFIVDEKKGCSSLDVTISDTNLMPAVGICGPGNPCDITWGDGSTQQIVTNTANHTYNQPGTYTLRILYQNVGFDDITVVVTPNTPPAFDIYKCGGDEVQVRVTDTNYDGYFINYNDGSPEVLVPKGSLAVNNHPYASSGTKTISVRGKDVNAADNCGSANQDVLAEATLPNPFINLLEVINGSRIDLSFTTRQNILYRLEIATNNNSTFQLAQMVYNNTSASLTNLQTNNNYYCFRLGAFDPCNNTVAYSNIICSANFNVTAQNNQNNLTWVTNATGVLNYSVNRDNSIISNPSSGSSAYTDNNVVCNTAYCYQLTTEYINGSQSISLVKCVTSFSSDQPTPVNNTTAIVLEPGVELIWQQDPAFQPLEYSLFRKEGAGTYQLFDKVLGLTYTDNSYTTEGEFCYQIRYSDVCGNTSPFSPEICPFRLSGELTSENYTQLSWTEYEGWLNGVQEYRIEKYSANGTLLQTIVLSPGTTSYLDTDIDPTEQVFQYVLIAVPNDPGLGQSISNEIVITKESRITFPTAFTPDNKGPADNEVFKVYGQYISNFEMQIFNRWGELIFSSNDIDKGWDGTYKGSNAPEGTYAFITRLVDYTGRSFSRSGSIVLLRKK